MCLCLTPHFGRPTLCFSFGLCRRLLFCLSAFFQGPPLSRGKGRGIRFSLGLLFKLAFSLRVSPSLCFDLRSQALCLRRGGLCCQIRLHHIRRLQRFGDAGLLAQLLYLGLQGLGGEQLGVDDRLLRPRRSRRDQPLNTHQQQ